MWKSILFNFGFMALCWGIRLFWIVVLARIEPVLHTNHFVYVLFRIQYRILHLSLMSSLCRSSIVSITILKTATTFYGLPLYRGTLPVRDSLRCFWWLSTLFDREDLCTESTATDVPLYACLYHGFLGDFLNRLSWLDLFSYAQASSLPGFRNFHICHFPAHKDNYNIGGAWLTCWLKWFAWAGPPSAWGRCYFFTDRQGSRN